MSEANLPRRPIHAYHCEASSPFKAYWHHVTLIPLLRSSTPNSSSCRHFIAKWRVQETPLLEQTIAEVGKSILVLSRGARPMAFIKSGENFVFLHHQVSQYHRLHVRLGEWMGVPQKRAARGSDHTRVALAASDAGRNVTRRSLSAGGAAKQLSTVNIRLNYDGVGGLLIVPGLGIV